ncbi:MAG: histone family protein [Candidatus Woesearchaeota archaeon]|nr:MAG: histone family protein [Candidatus Woesearchaeota archaeon]
MAKGILPEAAMERILKKAGISRVSEDAKTALREHLEARAYEICSKAAKLAEHSGRKTVMGDDVKLAVR